MSRCTLYLPNKTSKRKDAMLIVELARKSRKIEKIEWNNEGGTGSLNSRQVSNLNTYITISMLILRRQYPWLSIANPVLGSVCLGCPTGGPEPVDIYAIEILRRGKAREESGGESCKNCWDSKKHRPSGQDNALETTSPSPPLYQAPFTRKQTERRFSFNSRRTRRGV